MIGNKPKFYDSPFFVPDPGNFHLLPGAPKEVVDEFMALKQLREDLETGKIFEKLNKEPT
jgi:hypothetical protein